MAKQHLCVAPPVEMEAAGENDIFAPVHDELPSLPFAPEGGQWPVVTTPTAQNTVPVNIVVSSRGRTRKVSSQFEESVEQGLMSPLILDI